MPYLSLIHIWLFPILEEFTTTADMSLYTKEGLRTPGHLSERLLNVFLLHHERVGAGWKMKELQLSLIHIYLAARNHMADVRHAIQRADWDAQRVRIFVSAHKNVDLFDGNVLQLSLIHI